MSFNQERGVELWNVTFSRVMRLDGAAGELEETGAWSSWLSSVQHMLPSAGEGVQTLMQGLSGLRSQQPGQ